MPIELDRIGNALSRVLPFLAQEKAQREQVRQWLLRSLQEIAAREDSQRRLAADATRNAIMEKVAGDVGAYFRDVPGGAFFLPGYLKSVIPTAAEGIVDDLANRGIYDEVTKNLTDIYGQFQSGQDISADALRAVVGRIAGDIPKDIITKAAANKLEASSQEIAKERNRLEGTSQDIRRRELEQKGKDEKATKDTTNLGIIKEAQNDRDVAIQRYGGVGQIFGLMPDAKRALKASIKNANARIDQASKAMGVESPILTREEMFTAGLAILSRFASEGVLPDWYTLLYQGYDPDFVFGLQEVFTKPGKKKGAPSDKDAQARALALLKALQQGGNLEE